MQTKGVQHLSDYELLSDDQFSKLFKYIEDFRSEVNEKLDRKAEASALDNLISTMDDFISRITNNEAEQAARDAQFVR